MTIVLPFKPRVTPHPDRTDGPLDAPRVIVIHTTEGGESLTSAEGLASFVSRPKQTQPYVNVASYHWVCDANSVIPLAPENVVAYHAAGANGLSIGVCVTGKAGQTPEQWADDMSAPAVEWAARLCGERAQALGIPLHRLSVDELRAGVSGICGHDDVRAAWQRTTHTDPGPHFPWDRFMALAADQITPPPDFIPSEDDMRYRLFSPHGYYDTIAVGPGVPFNPGNADAAQELVDNNLVNNKDGSPKTPGTPYNDVVIKISVGLWTQMNGGRGPGTPGG